MEEGSSDINSTELGSLELEADAEAPVAQPNPATCDLEIWG